MHRILPRAMRRYRALHAACARSFGAEKATTGPSLVSVHSSDGVTIISMDAPPVNALSLPMLRELISANEAAKADPKTRGVVVQSSSEKVFSAGLDLSALQGSKDEVEALWRDGVQELFKSFFESPLVTAAAIGGHAPAGGCFLALLCDIRVMSSGPGRIGLNETLLGISPPWYFADVMKSAVGQREAEKAVQLGTLYSPEDALKAGLVDAVADSKEHAEEMALAEVHRWLQVPDVGRQRTKRTIRDPVICEFNAAREEDLEEFLRQVESPELQSALGHYLASLDKRK